ncbi:MULTISPECIES: glutamate--tRNA ligase [unclassified Marinitoga]|uniref:glutamate--tRNA ligase n=1 Tax=unclassified Marinitoga TaxID=2640159 RepID=UPI000640D48E|nr:MULTISPECIES: glutamate--tRNA ligase [unclassified Marinitoga]KLO21417.1 glutamyl-tRNA synthetase [Marinitoga sp. 1155]NUU99801.1 glutamyl-tRNA synthetase [Marinitoga sp. 1154]
MKVRVRFAPSPTGFLHVGGARTALYNYLFAKKHNGTFVLRIEDTDVERSTKESEEQLIEALTWLGLDWDEGPNVKGEYGPYRQSERTYIYKQMTEELINKGKAYYAYVYPEDLEKIKAELIKNGKPPHYSYELIESYNTEERKKEFNEKGLKPVVFFKMPRKPFSINDLIKGPVTFGEGAIGDFIIMRSNGLPTYNYAVVIDDMTMEITHVIRGDDHLSNTLRQVALYEAFGVKIPEFAHVSMILGPDGKKLSKRHGATSVEEFRNKGYLPEALVNYLALLGWSHPEGKEIMPLNEMIENFDLNRVNSSPAIFDNEKLKWMNGVYIREAKLDRIVKLSKLFILEKGLLSKEQFDNNKKWVTEAVDIVRESVEDLSQIPEKLEIFLKDFEVDLENAELKDFLQADGVKNTIKLIYEKVLNDPDWKVETILKNIKEAMKEGKPKKKPFYMSLRKILTDSFEGPDLVKTIHLIGRNRVLQRLERVVGKW